MVTRLPRSIIREAIVVQCSRRWCSLVLLLKLFWTCTILTKVTCRILTYLQCFGVLNPPPFWHFCTILTNLHHLNTYNQNNSKLIFLVVWKGTSEDCGQSKQSEFTRPRLIFRFVMDLYIVKVTISFCSIKYWIAQYAQLNIWRRVEHESKQSVSLLGSKGTNEYISGQSKQSELTRLMKTY